ncbi:MAG: hypothetical protein AB8B84_10780 [Granulosicoccus sp.]
MLQQLDAVATQQAEVDEDDEQSLFTLITTNVPLSVQLAFSHIGGVIPGQQKIFGMFINRLSENGVWKLVVGRSVSGATLAALVTAGGSVLHHADTTIGTFSGHSHSGAGKALDATSCWRWRGCF